MCMETSKQVPTPSPESGFPRKAALSIACAVGLLCAAHLYKDGSHGFRFSTVADVVQFHWPKPPAETVLLGQAENDKNTANTVTRRGPISHVMLDDQMALDPFFESLWHLERRQSRAAEMVTILHYGDSPTTADLITGDARAILQKRFGDAGFGFNLAAKPWAWYGHRNVEIHDHGWASSQKDATGVGRYKQGSYGLGGAVFAGGAGSQTTYTLTGTPQRTVDVLYLASPSGGVLSVQANGTSIGEIDTQAESVSAQAKHFVLPEGTRHVVLEVASGTVKAFGADFRTGGAGVLYDSLGLNGATTTILSRTFDPGLLSQSLHYAHPQLVIINYGTNESQFSGLIDNLEKELKLAIEHVRTADPHVPILIMSPMDRGERAGGDIHTMGTIPQIVAIQRRVAEETHCAFFDTYDAMGGAGTVGRWYATQPRLMTADLIHPTPQGAAIVANLLIDNLLVGYDHWKKAHAIATVEHVPMKPPVLPSAPAAAQPSSDLPQETPMREDVDDHQNVPPSTENLPASKPQNEALKPLPEPDEDHHEPAQPPEPSSAPHEAPTSSSPQ